MQNCAVCGQPMDYIKAGYSKTTGRPYQAFYACSDRNHKQPRQQAQTPVQQFNQSLDQDNNDLKWKKINAEKEESIRWCNAINNAALLIAHNPVVGATDQELVNRLYMLALRIDALEPKAPQTNTEVGSQAIPATTRVLAQNNEEPVDLDSIPF